MKNSKFKIQNYGLFLTIILHFTFFIFNCIYSATISIQRIGCVDINRIIEEYPEAKKIKDEMSANLQARKENIKNFENQIETLENEITSMEEQLQKYEESKKEIEIYSSSTPIPSEVNLSTETAEIVAVSTESIAVPVEISSPTFTMADVEAKKNLVEKQKQDLEKYIAVTKKEEKEITRKIKKNMLGKIYDAIKEVAVEEGLTIIVDSYNLIYGEDAQDITDKVLKKLK
ncbi:MAG: OmpH family outer membrane protein [Elusimicrobiota bacterium]